MKYQWIRHSAKGLGLAAAVYIAGTSAALAGTTFRDDFNGPAGAPIDGSKWHQETGDNNGNNHERQWYTPGTHNAALDGQGHLVITARRDNPNNYTCWYGRCQYTSARFNTAGKFDQAYGHFEARMKLPRGQGMWPAFWMLGANIGSIGWPQTGEIDIMENIGREPNTVHGTIHGPGYSGGNSIGAVYNGPNFSDAFHTYAVDWSPNRIAWSVDGNVYEVRTPNDLGGRQWVYDHPFFLILNLAVGGDFPGDPDGSTRFPQQLVVDYVAVTTDANQPPARSGAITGIGGMCVDVANASSANGTPLQLHYCTGNAAQQWSVGPDDSIRALGKCMDARGSGTANGTPVQLYDCNGSGAQRWAISPANDIVNIHANKCLDAKGQSSADGTRLQLWECSGNPNQKWHVGN